MRNPRHKGVPETFSKSHILFKTELGLDPDHCSLTSFLFALYQANHCCMFSINHNDAEKAPTSFVFFCRFPLSWHKNFWKLLALSCLRRWSCFIFQTSGSRTSMSIKSQEQKSFGIFIQIRVVWFWGRKACHLWIIILCFLSISKMKLFVQWSHSSLEELLHLQEVMISLS